MITKRNNNNNTQIQIRKREREFIIPANISVGIMSSREFNFEDIPPCPELHPSMQEFSDFSSYVESVEK